MDKPFDLLLFDPGKLWGLPAKEYLEKDKRYRVTFLPDLSQMEKEMPSGKYILAIINLEADPQESFSIVHLLRTRYDDISVIFISPKTEKKILFEAYRKGADDFMYYPFAEEELVARVDAIIKRTHQGLYNRTVNISYKIGQYYFDTHKQTLVLGDQIHKLTTKESELLLLLCQSANQLLHRQQVLQAVWKNDSYFSARSMDVYITKLRKLLSNDPTVAITNIHGKGYKLETNQL